MCRVTSLCLALTRWLTMCDPDVLPRELQNQRLQMLQLTFGKEYQAILDLLFEGRLRVDS